MHFKEWKCIYVIYIFYASWHLKYQASDKFTDFRIIKSGGKIENLGVLTFSFFSYVCIIWKNTVLKLILRQFLYIYTIYVITYKKISV